MWEAVQPGAGSDSGTSGDQEDAGPRPVSCGAFPSVEPATKGPNPLARAALLCSDERRVEIPPG